MTGVRRRVLAAAVVFVAALVASWVVAAVGPRNWSPPMCGIAVAVVLAGLIWPRGS